MISGVFFCYLFQVFSVKLVVFKFRYFVFSLAELPHTWDSCLCCALEDSGFREIMKKCSRSFQGLFQVSILRSF